MLPLPHAGRCDGVQTAQLCSARAGQPVDFDNFATSGNVLHPFSTSDRFALAITLQGARSCFIERAAYMAIRVARGVPLNMIRA